MTQSVLSGERLSRMIQTTREKCDALDPIKASELEDNLDITFEEHFKFQQLQSQFHAAGKLSPEAAMIVYQSLGEACSGNNGGWRKDTDLATKVIVTQLMGELLRMDLARRGVKV